MSRGIMEGVRVLDMSRFIAGAFSVRWLADMGADVIKVEPPGGDFRDTNLVRDEKGELFPQFHTDTPAIGGLHGGFIQANSGKRGICVDMKAPGAMELVERLIAASEIVVESFTPHVFKSWGLTYDRMREIRPDIIFVQASGFGQDSPDDRAVCTAPTAAAKSGFSHGIGYPDDYPLENMFAIGDTVSATVTAIAILGAYIHKLRTGEGQHVDTAMVDSLAALDCRGLPHVATSRGEYDAIRSGYRSPTVIPQGIFRVKREYVSIQAGGGGAGVGAAASGWGRLCLVMSRPDLVDDPDWFNDNVRRKHEDTVWQLIEEWLDQNFETAQEVADFLQSHQILASKVNSPKDILTDPHYVRRGLLVDVDYPLIGPLATISTPNKFATTPVQVTRAPFLGEHNEEALHDWLGMSAEQIEGLYSRGILQQDSLVGALRSTGELPDPWNAATARA